MYYIICAARSILVDTVVAIVLVKDQHSESILELKNQTEKSN